MKTQLHSRSKGVITFFHNPITLQLKELVMAKRYISPEERAERAPTNEPLSLTNDTNGFGYIKMLVSDQNLIPRGLLEEPPREGVLLPEQYTGTLAFEVDHVGVELFRTGLVVNPEGKKWSLVNAGWRKQTITSPSMRRIHGNYNFAIKLLYCDHPGVGEAPSPIVLPKQAADDFRVLARSMSWAKCRVWNNHNTNGAFSIILTSPKLVEQVPIRRRVVVNKGHIDIVPV